LHEIELKVDKGN